MKPASIRAIIIIFSITVLLFVGGQFLGVHLFENAWSFSHWSSQGYTYGLVWAAILAASFALVSWFARTGKLPEKPSQLEWPLLGALAALLIVFQFDSILYGGGNLRVAQIAQAERVVFRWFEAGATAIVSGFHLLTSLFPIHYNTAGIWAWKLFSFLCAGLAIFGVIYLSRQLSSDRLKRMALVVLALFGGPMLGLFGYVGIAPAIVATLIWFMALAVKITKEQLSRDKLLLAILVLGGTALHYSLIIMLPAAVFLIVSTVRTHRRRYLLAKVAAMVTLIGLIVLHTLVEERSLEYVSNVLTMQGRLPFTDYGIISVRHLSDMAQLLLLAVPLVLVVFPFVFSRPGIAQVEPAIWSGWFLFLSGLVYVFVYNPVHSIVLDLPTMAAYLSPVSLLVAIYVGSLDFAETRERQIGLMLATFALLVPFAYLPSHVNIERSEPYVRRYLDEHPYFFRTAVAAYRDAYFAIGNYDKANEWEQKWESLSPEIVNLRGSSYLAEQHQETEALRRLYFMIAADPYWAEPRALVAQIQMKLGRPQLASPQVDTCLQLEPYTKAHLVNRYALLRDLGNYSGALAGTKRALQYFPGDIEIRTDQMLMTYRAGDLPGAGTLADDLLATDSTRAFAHLIKGLLAEQNKQIDEALNRYERFVTLAPTEPEAEVIQARMQRLRAAMQ